MAATDLHLAIRSARGKRGREGGEMERECLQGSTGMGPPSMKMPMCKSGLASLWWSPTNLLSARERHEARSAHDEIDGSRRYVRKAAQIHHDQIFQFVVHGGIGWNEDLVKFRV